jgi:lysophospholipase L1-like esterase
MAASLTIANGIPLAADGKTLTVPVGGSSGTLALSSGSVVTGVTVTVTDGGLSTVHTVAASSFSGTDLILTVPVIKSTATVTVGIATSSNLTDSSANTVAASQTGRTVTNGSAATFTAFGTANAAVVQLGEWGSQTLVSRAGISLAGSGSRIVVTPTGGEIALVYYQVAGSATVYVNGSLAATLATTTGWTATTVRTGSDAAVDLEIRGVNGSVFETAGFLRVSGTGTVAMTSGYRQPTYMSDAVAAGTVAVEGLRPITTAGYTAHSYYINTASTAGTLVRFRARISTLRMWVNGVSGQPIKLVIDPDWTGSGRWTYSQSLTIPNDAQWQPVAFTGLDASAEHEYVLFTALPTNFWLHSLIFGGGTGLSTSLTYTPRPVIGVYGDSIESGTGTGITDIQDVSGWKAAKALNMGAMVYGVISRTVKDYTAAAGSTNAPAFRALSGETNTASMHDLTPALAGVLIKLGANDIGNTAGATTPQTASDHQTACASMLTNLRAGNSSRLTNAYVFDFGITPRLNYTQATVDAWNASKAAAGTSAGGSKYRELNPKRLAMAGTAYRDGTAGAESNSANFSTYFSDGLHPTLTGHDYEANFAIPYLAEAAGTTGYTLAVTGTGLTKTFTITRAGGSTFITGETVTIDPGDGTGNLTITPTAGQTTGSTTHAYAAGTYTAAPTNAQGWTNPASQSVTATSPGPTAGTLSNTAKTSTTASFTWTAGSGTGTVTTQLQRSPSARGRGPTCRGRRRVRPPTPAARPPPRTTTGWRTPTATGRATAARSR